jgi:hypothetical protein
MKITFLFPELGRIEKFLLENQFLFLILSLGGEPEILLVNNINYNVAVYFVLRIKNCIFKAKTYGFNSSIF